MECTAENNGSNGTAADVPTKLAKWRATLALPLLFLHLTANERTNSNELQFYVQIRNCSNN